MSDKKVGRFGGRPPITPTEKMEAALSDPGTMNVADAPHDKGRSALVDKFREREEKWRREQAMHGQREAQAVERGEQPAEGPDEPTERRGEEEGGRS
jgi:hypothetical protein